jgi:hypothetical protein
MGNGTKRYSVFNVDRVAPNHIAPRGSHYRADGHADSFESSADAMAFAALLRRKTGERIVIRDVQSGATIWPRAGSTPPS